MGYKTLMKPEASESLDMLLELHRYAHSVGLPENIERTYEIIGTLSTEQRKVLKMRVGMRRALPAPVMLVTTLTEEQLTNSYLTMHGTRFCGNRNPV